MPDLEPLPRGPEARPCRCWSGCRPQLPATSANAWYGLRVARWKMAVSQATGRCRIGTVMLVVGCSFVLKVPPRTSLLARGPVIDRATGQVVSLTRSRRLLSMADAKQIESTAKAAAEVHKAIFALGQVQKEMQRARLLTPTQLEARDSVRQSEREKGGVLIHTVVAGDSLTAIARRYRVSLESLVGANREIKDPNHIILGQRLRIPRVHAEQGGPRVHFSGQRFTEDGSAEDEESAYAYVNISKDADTNSAQCVAAVVCHNPEGRYQEIYNSAANFVAYLQISGSTRQLHRFVPTHHHPTPGAPDPPRGVYRAYYHDYGPGLVYKSKILVLLNTSARGHRADADTCLREQRPSQFYSSYKFTWISTGRHLSEGGYFQAAPAAGKTDPQRPLRFHEPATTVQRDLSRELRAICSFGDSQMRNNIMSLLQSRFPECTGSKDSVRADACPSTKSGYFNISYAADFLAPALRGVWGNATRCPLVIVNFGQWDLGWPSGFMTPFREYVKDVNRVLQAYLAVREPESLIWATINPHPLPRRPCTKEWRFLDLIERFNEGATAAAKVSNVSVWDTYSVLKHVFDLPYDGAHGHYWFPDAVRASLLRLLTERNGGVGRRSAPS